MTDITVTLIIRQDENDIWFIDKAFNKKVITLQVYKLLEKMKEKSKIFVSCMPKLQGILSTAIRRESRSLQVRLVKVLQMLLVFLWPQNL